MFSEKGLYQRSDILVSISEKERVFQAIPTIHNLPSILTLALQDDSTFDPCKKWYWHEIYKMDMDSVDGLEMCRSILENVDYEESWREVLIKVPQKDLSLPFPAQKFVEATLHSSHSLNILYCITDSPEFITVSKDLIDLFESLKV